MDATPKARYDWADIAKGIGILLVVLCHFLQGVYRRGMFPYPEVYCLLNDWIYAFHMPLFFFLAGMFVDASIERRGRRGVLEARLETLMYPYLVWSVLQVFTKRLFSAQVNVETQLADLLWIWCSPLEHLWFLYALFICYALYLALYRVKDAALGVGVLLFVVSPWIHHELSFKVALFFVYFALGATLRGKLLELPLFVALTIFCLSEGLQGHMSPWSSHPLKMAAALSGISVTFHVSQWLAATFMASPWRVLGRDSLAIYLLHPYGSVIWRMVVVRLQWLSTILVPVGLLSALLFGIVGSRAVKRLRLPLFKFFVANRK